MESPHSAKIKARLKRVAGQVAGIQRMVEEDRYCLDILNQISAVRSALDAVGVELLTRHIEGCVAGHDGSQTHSKARPMKPEQLIEELRTALARFLK